MQPFVRLAALALTLSIVLPAQAEERRMAPSDPEAVRLAKRVMKGMGGREAWSGTRYIAWNFFGKRFHIWDTWTNRLRMDAFKEYSVIVDLDTLEGTVWKDGELLEGEEAAQALSRSKRVWINDSYWLAMPYKLLDPGVRLRGPRKIIQPDGDEALAIRLTFDDVGATPWNAYDVHVDPESFVVNGWAFYGNAAEPQPRWELPWVLERRGRILLPVDHGRGGPWEVEVFDELPESVFESQFPRFDMARLLDIATPAERVEPE